MGYCPAHVTGFFRIYEGGSTGAGFNLEKGMTTKVETRPGKKADTVFINGKKDSARVSRNVIGKYRYVTDFAGGLGVRHETEIPIGFGLGMSGAGAYSLSIALNQALRAGLGKERVLMQAFLAEIEEGTGLGTVIADTARGLLLGLPPYPSKKVRELKSEWRHAAVAFFQPINTGKIIHNKKWKERINEAGDQALRSFRRKPTAKNFVKCARGFTFESGLAGRQVERVLNEVPGTSMAMLGQTVYKLTNRPAEAAEALKAYSKKVLVSRFNLWPAKLLR